MKINPLKLVLTDFSIYICSITNKRIMGIFDKIIKESEYNKISKDVRSTCITTCHDIIKDFDLTETEIHFDDRFVYHKPIGDDEYSQHHIQSIKMDKSSYIHVNVDGEWKPLHECGMIEHTMIKGKMEQYANDFKTI